MDYILSINLLIHVLISIIILWVSMSLGKILMSYASGYQPLAGLFDSDNGNVGFNTIYRILFTPVAIVIVAIIAYSLKWDSLVNYIWLISVYVLILQALLITVIGRWKLVDKNKFFIFHFISITISYYIYVAAISKGIAFLLPDQQSVRTEMWIIIALFLYGVLKNIHENPERITFRKNNYIKAKARHFRKKYAHIFNDYDDALAEILVAIMIYENFNRPLIARGLEKLTFSKTQYIMQHYGAKSDEESLRLTAEGVRRSYETFAATTFNNEWEKQEALRSIFSMHNPGDYSYSNRVLEIYEVIK